MADKLAISCDEETKTRIHLLSFLVIIFTLSLGVIAVVMIAEQTRGKEVVHNLQTSSQVLLK